MVTFGNALESWYSFERSNKSSNCSFPVELGWDSFTKEQFKLPLLGPSHQFGFLHRLDVPSPLECQGNIGNDFGKSSAGQHVSTHLMIENFHRSIVWGVYLALMMGTGVIVYCWSCRQIWALWSNHVLYLAAVLNSVPLVLTYSRVSRNIHYLMIQSTTCLSLKCKAHTIWRPKIRFSLGEFVDRSWPHIWKMGSKTIGYLYLKSTVSLLVYHCIIAFLFSCLCMFHVVKLTYIINTNIYNCNSYHHQF